MYSSQRTLFIAISIGAVALVKIRAPDRCERRGKGKLVSICFCQPTIIVARKVSCAYKVGKGTLRVPLFKVRELACSFSSLGAVEVPLLRLITCSCLHRCGRYTQVGGPAGATCEALLIIPAVTVLVGLMKPSGAFAALMSEVGKRRYVAPPLFGKLGGFHGDQGGRVRPA